MQSLYRERQSSWAMSLNFHFRPASGHCFWEDSKLVDIITTGMLPTRLSAIFLPGLIKHRPWTWCIFWQLLVMLLLGFSWHDHSWYTQDVTGQWDVQNRPKFSKSFYQMADSRTICVKNWSKTNYMICSFSILPNPNLKRDSFVCECTHAVVSAVSGNVYEWTPLVDRLSTTYLCCLSQSN